MPDLTLLPDFGCAAVRDALPDLLHGRLDGGARLPTERHVAECAGCAAELALLRDARAAVHAGAPAVDVAAVAAAVRAATVPAGGARQPARPALEVSRSVPSPPRVAAPGRWRAGRPLLALAATVLVAVGAGAAWLGAGGGSGAGRDAAGDTAGAVAGVVARAPLAADGGAGPAVLATAEPGLGARFDDLTDEELQAVIAAVEGSDRTLPDEELAPAAPELDGGA
jgi:anti-sigma factor RsiW